MPSAWSQGRLKRALDIVGSGLLLVLTAPVSAVLAVLVRRKMGSPVLFHHDRAGRDGVPFTMVKFRSMTDPCDAQGQEIPEELRITALGRWMRATSLDELPELVNVLRGDMSLVGPRPLLLEYRELYSQEQQERLDVRPGVTGLAQVSGRNALTWEDKFRLDVEYVRTATLRVDLTILVRTVREVLRREGIATDGHATSPKFAGSAECPTASIEPAEQEIELPGSAREG